MLNLLKEKFIHKEIVNILLADTNDVNYSSLVFKNALSFALKVSDNENFKEYINSIKDIESIPLKLNNNERKSLFLSKDNLAKDLFIVWKNVGYMYENFKCDVTGEITTLPDVVPLDEEMESLALLFVESNNLVFEKRYQNVEIKSVFDLIRNYMFSVYIQSKSEIYANGFAKKVINEFCEIAEDEELNLKMYCSLIKIKQEFGDINRNFEQEYINSLNDYQKFSDYIKNKCRRILTEFFKKNDDGEYEYDSISKKYSLSNRVKLQILSGLACASKILYNEENVYKIIDELKVLDNSNLGFEFKNEQKFCSKEIIAGLYVYLPLAMRDSDALYLVSTFNKNKRQSIAQSRRRSFGYFDFDKLKVVQNSIYNLKFCENN